MGPFLLENALPKGQPDKDVLTPPPSESVTAIKNGSVFSDMMGGDVKRATPEQEAAVAEAHKVGNIEPDEAGSDPLANEELDPNAEGAGVPTGDPNPTSIGPPVSVGGSGRGASGLTANVKEIEINPRRNELNNYSSYTYNMTLYMLTPKEYIKMMKNPLHPKAAK